MKSKRKRKRKRDRKRKRKREKEKENEKGELLAFSPLTPIGIVTLHRRLEGAPCKKSAGERIFVIPRANPYIYPQIFFALPGVQKIIDFLH